MEQIFHFIGHLIGFCPDHHNHLNLIVLIGDVFNQNICWCYLKSKYYSVFKTGKEQAGVSSMKVE